MVRILNCRTMQATQEITTLSFKISVFTNIRKSGKATRKLNRQYGSKGARVVKSLVPDESLASIQAIAKELRSLIDSHTLLWDKGVRLLPMGKKGFYGINFLTKIGGLQEEFNEEVDVFMAKYPKLRDEGLVENSGFFGRHDYPTVEEMRAKFGVRLGTMHIRPEDDYRSSIVSKKIMDEIQDRTRLEMDRLHGIAINSMYERVKDVIKRIKILDKPVKKGGRRGYFKDTVYDTIREMIDVFPSLNYTNDPKIAKMTKDLKGLLVDTDNLRTDDAARQAYLDKAKALEQAYLSHL